ncbi:MULTISPECIES: CatA-like O-acetyltransferase [unclassified Tenacibaculum]|uniref:CatA-like O-acetyltransferase n=1 Tax=unclassified Tenacibaculum TaxID=2635139 RepID=UPI001F2DD9B6|nr:MULTISPECIES: CatA-like O-acetyltransferase [unclassified Tenacibaculum]MCF2874424.1 CatA-like O-acetyltransferase [Tenacibaculum sp. Cn5-1]MCF2935005.1 CatA-like O-acetyltransferase [Tenacibaculum sp. Cn5-34]MCG7511215.1 CatA-like O-acetyltransferase [Tenacibaculum sp. Cn5-46]
MKYLDIENWKRKQHFEHFRTLADPTFGLVADVEVSKAYQLAKEKGQSFFVKYLHACLIALNAVESFKYRIEEDGRVAIYDVINASATIARPDNTFGFSYIEFSENIEEFNRNFLEEKERIINSNNLFPPKYSPGCIHCSALPWVSFSSHKEPFSGNKNDSVPQLAFGKIKKEHGKMLMPIAVNVNHALIDGYDVGQFFEKFQAELDKIN